MSTKCLRLLLAFGITLAIWTAGCGILKGLVGLRPETLDVLSAAIEELGRQPGRWENTMENTIKQLEESGTELSRNVLAEVRQTYNGMLGQTGSEFSCRTDFIANRLQQRLQAIGHSYDPSRFSAPRIYPVICSTNPGDQITLGTKTVTYYGYDLSDFSETNRFEAVLRYADDGTVVHSQAGYPSTVHNYQVTVDLQSPELQRIMNDMDRDRGPQLVLKWGNQDVKNDEGDLSALPIILPELPPTYVYMLVPNDFYWFGGWGGTGGREDYLTCGGNEVATAIYAMAGAMVDAIALRCSSVNSDGTLGQESYTEWRGGGGGDLCPLECSANRALKGADVRSGRLVDQLRGICTSITDESVSSKTAKAGGEGGEEAMDQECDPGYFVTGIRIRWGQMIDSIAFRCTKVARIRID
jgi:hypothetical protein